MAVALGISPRRLWGWEPTVTTEFFRDEDGWIVASEATAEPEYSTEDLTMLAAWHELKDETGNYGENLVEAFDPMSDASNPRATHRYVAGEYVNGEWVPLVNHAEKAVQDAIQARRKKYGDNDNENGHTWPVRRVEIPGR